MTTRSPRHLRVTKRRWYASGGLANPRCFRKQRGTCWTYWIEIDT